MKTLPCRCWRIVFDLPVRSLGVCLLPTVCESALSLTGPQQAADDLDRIFVPNEAAQRHGAAAKRCGQSLVCCRYALGEQPTYRENVEAKWLALGNPTRRPTCITGSLPAFR